MTQTSDLKIRSRHSNRRPNCAGGAQATNSSAPLWIGASQDELGLQPAAGIGTALLFACLVPAAAMAALWSSANIGGSAFVLTFGMAFAHAILLGLPLFLIFRSKDWVDVATCAIAGFAIGAGPAAVLSWPTQHPQAHAVGPTMSDTAVLIARWGDYLTPPAHFGMFGALGGVVFWLVLTSFEVVGKSAVHVRFLQSRRLRT
jgi:hypothetical protein